MADHPQQSDKPYLLDIPGLAEAVDGIAPTSNHKSLIAALRRLPGLDGARLATWRGGI